MNFAPLVTTFLTATGLLADIRKHMGNYPGAYDEKGTIKIYRKPHKMIQDLHDRWAGLQREYHSFKKIPKKHQKVLNKLNKIFPSSTKMPPRRKSRKATKKRTYKKKSSIEKCFPSSKLVQLNCYHLAQVDPPASSGVGYGIVNMNNPNDPLTLGTGNTLNSTEHHPKHWELYSSIYDKFEVISCKATFTFIGNQNSLAHSYVVVPASTISKDEVLTMLTDTNTFSARLKESNKKAIVKFHGGSANESDKVVLYSKANIRKLEGLPKGDPEQLQGQTASSGTETAPERTPVIYYAVGTNSGGVSDDLTYVKVMIKLDYVVLFSGLSPDTEGVAI